MATQATTPQKEVLVEVHISQYALDMFLIYDLPQLKLASCLLVLDGEAAANCTNALVGPEEEEALL